MFRNMRTPFSYLNHTQLISQCCFFLVFLQNKMNLKCTSVTSFKTKKPNNSEIRACLAPKYNKMSFDKPFSHLNVMIKILWRIIPLLFLKFSNKLKYSGKNNRQCLPAPSSPLSI